jgi:hypothetical protein
LLRQAYGLEGFRMSQKVADASDLPRSKVKDFSDFLGELDAGRPGGQVNVTEGEDRLAEVAELLGPIGEAFPRLAAVLRPNLPRAVMTLVGRCLPLKAGSIAGCHSTSASSSAKKASRSSAFHASTARWTVSTFSCDIARAEYPALGIVPL